MSFSRIRPRLRSFDSLLSGSVLPDGTGQSRVTAVCAIPCRRETIAAAVGDGVSTHGHYAHVCKQARKQQFMHACAQCYMHCCLQAGASNRLGLSGRALHADMHAHQQVGHHANKQSSKQTCEPTGQHASQKKNMHACLQATMHAKRHANLLANMKGSM